MIREGKKKKKEKKAKWYVNTIVSMPSCMQTGLRAGRVVCEQDCDHVHAKWNVN